MMRKIKQASIVDTSLPASTMPPEPPKLFWIGTEYSHTCLWPHSISSPDRDSQASLQEFLEVLMEAKFRVWLMDPHFDGECGYVTIEPALRIAYDEAKRQNRQLDIRILTGRLKELEECFKVKYPNDSHVHRREWYRGWHDRYALIDRELWHFGSTVGGGYPGLSSASRGWFDHVENFSILFINWWGKA